MTAQDTASASSVPFTNEKVYTIVEEMPRFPGCEDLAGTQREKDYCAKQKMRDFISTNMQFPESAKRQGIEGTVVVQFIVEKDGQLNQIKLLRRIGGNCGLEALRLIRLMEKENLKWRPGYMQSRPVRVKYNLPIKFSAD